MTLKLAYWVFAYVLTWAAVAVAMVGVRRIRSGDERGHQRLLTMANNLILFFVVTYVFKMFLLGREDKSDWTVFYLVVLYIHEAFIGFMLIAGVTARVLAEKFKSTLEPGAEISEQNAKRRRIHKRAGKLTIQFALLALATATVVLWGMFDRAGLI